MFNAFESEGLLFSTPTPCSRIRKHILLYSTLTLFAMEYDPTRFGPVADEYLPMATLLQKAIQEGGFLIVRYEYVYPN